MRTRLLTLWASLLLAAGTAGQAQCHSLPGSGAALQMDDVPAGVIASRQYSAQVIVAGGGAARAFVYQVRNPGFLPNGQPSGIVSSSTLEHGTAWTSFSFAGSVTVQVTNKQAFSSARILPSSAHIIPVVRGHSVSFTTDRPGQFAVDFCATGATCTESNDTDITNPMLVFANPLEARPPDPASAKVLVVEPGLSVPSGNPVPALGAGQTTLYFGPGIYDLGLKPLAVASHERVYLAAGAYVKGFLAFSFGASDAVIDGRGILSGERLPKSRCIATVAGCPDMVEATGPVQGLRVEGITFIQSPFYNISLNGGSGNVVDNVKVIAWLGNSDGIQAGFGSADTGSVIENSFVKNGDDSIKLTTSNLLVQHCVVWKMNNAAAFQMGAGIGTDVSNVTVRDSDVIRTEYAYPNTSTAVFAANQGGAGNLSDYVFDDIRVENAPWQAFKILVVPSNFEPGNYQLGSISNIAFNNIHITDPQRFPAMFRGYDLAHEVSNVTFRNVVIGGVQAPQPTMSLDANRVASYAGNTVSDLLLRSEAEPDGFDIALFTLAPPVTASQYALFSVSQPLFSSSFDVQASGDFFGDGFASAVATDTSTGEVGIWKEPYRNSASPGNAQYSTVYRLGGSDGTVAGAGDFDGDGYSDILLWNAGTQTGTMLFMSGDHVVRRRVFQPGTASSWAVAGIADFTGDGRSDVLLRDAAGNLEVVSFDASSMPAAADFPVGSLGYESTPNSTATYGATSGVFDAGWSVAGTGLLQTLGTDYASIIWVNQATGQVGVTHFTPFAMSASSGQVFAKLPAQTEIEAVGDFNGDGAKDLLLLNVSTFANTVWFLNYDAGALYQQGPVLLPGLPAGLQPVGQ